MVKVTCYGAVLTSSQTEVLCWSKRSPVNTIDFVCVPTSHDSSVSCEEHLKVLPEPAGVVVDDRLGITEGFHQRVDL